MTFFLRLLWGAAILCAFLGYGEALLRAFGIRTARLGGACCIGVSLLMVFGSLLNGAGLITRPVLVGVVVLGMLLGLITLTTRMRSAITGFATASTGALTADSWKNLSNLALFAILCGLLAVPVLTSVRANIGFYNRWDDLSNYITIPVETLQLGALPTDPFSERRITTSLGGAYFLQSLMLVFADIRSLPFVDVSLGFVLFPATLFEVCRTLNLSVRQSLLVCLLVVIVPTYCFNLTMVVLPAAIFASLLLIQLEPAFEAGGSWQRSCLIGLTAAAACCLKSTYIPSAVVICGFYLFGLGLYSGLVKAIWQTIILAAAGVGSLLLWMLDMKQKEGTYLYPILGRGYDASNYGVVPLPSGSGHNLLGVTYWVWVSVALLCGPLIMFLWAPLTAHLKGVGNKWIAFTGMLLATIVGTFAMGASTGGQSVGRYSAAFSVPTGLAMVAFLISWANASCKPAMWLKSAALIGGAYVLILAGIFGWKDGQYRRFAQEAGLIAAPKQMVDLNAEKARLAALQARIPPNQTLYAHLLVNFGLDFRRNRVYNADFAGMAGLPPGMPVGKGPDALRAYLIDHQIRFVAFDSKRFVWTDDYPTASLQAVLHNPKAYGHFAWSVVADRVIQDQEKNLAVLAQYYNHLYDDGVVVLLDLQSPSDRRANNHS